MSHVLTRYVGNLQRKSSYLFSKRGGKDVSNVIDPFNIQRPSSLEELSHRTKFTVHEIKSLYQKFKQQFPRGVLTHENFKTIFHQIYSSGKSDKYASLVFRALDKEKSGFINFDTILEFMSQTCHGDLEENCEWIFTLYDINGDGFVSREELLEVALAIYCLDNSYINPPILSNITTHMATIFKKMDAKNQGAVDMNTFCKFCINQKPEILESIQILKTTII